ncbi:unnamed protein product, partial [Prorocentrum cordatum]
PTRPRTRFAPRCATAPLLGAPDARSADGAVPHGGVRQLVERMPCSPHLPLRGRAGGVPWATGGAPERRAGLRAHAGLRGAQEEAGREVRRGARAQPGAPRGAGGGLPRALPALRPLWRPPGGLAPLRGGPGRLGGPETGGTASGGPPE